MKHALIKPSRKTCRPRGGIGGNPYDGLGGEVLSCPLDNFCAEVAVYPSERLEIVRHCYHDQDQWNSLGQFLEYSQTVGYDDARKIFMASLTNFVEMVEAYGHIIDPKVTFRIVWNTNIPRSCGFAGSTALEVAMTKALMESFGLSYNDIPMELLPGWILRIETEKLGRAAGPHDPAVQVYGRLLYMDFDPQFVGVNGHGKFVVMNHEALPAMKLVYNPKGGQDSHQIHRQVWANPEDSLKQEALQLSKDSVQKLVKAFHDRDPRAFGEAMNQSMAARHLLYGKRMEELALRMWQTARDQDCYYNQTGSGGAGLFYSTDQSKEEQVTRAYESEGWIVAPARFCRQM